MTMVVSSKLSTSSTPETVRDSRPSKITWWAASGRTRFSSYCILIPPFPQLCTILWDRAVRYASQWERARFRGRASRVVTAIFKKSPGR